MSSSRNKAIVRYNTGESGDPTGPSTSTDPSSKRRRKQDTDANEPNANVSLNDAEINRIVYDCVKYLVISDKKVPIKRSDMIKTVAKQTLNRKTVDDIMNQITSELSSVFGIDLVECPESSSAISYIMINKLPAEGLREAVGHQVMPNKQLYQSTLLSIVLSVIFMSGGTVHEDVVWKFLNRLKFDITPKSKQLISLDDSNSITLRKLVTEVWPRQLYIKYTKIERSDPIAHEFQWGFRADKEFSKMDILKFVCRMFNDENQFQFWRTQYEAAQQEIQSNDEVIE